jgi:hypothetical protein
MCLGCLAGILALLLGVYPSLAQGCPHPIPPSSQPTEKAKLAHRRAPPKIAAPRIAAPVTVAAKTTALKADSVGTESAAETSAGLSDSERLKIQSALLWSGDYTGSIGGEDPFLSAVRNFQKRAKAKIKGILIAAERANLPQPPKLRGRIWTIVTDPSTGVSWPACQIVTQRREATRGTRYSSPHGSAG